MGVIDNISFWFPLLEPSLVIFENWLFQPPLSLQELCLSVLIVASYVFGVFSALLLPELLSSLGWWIFSCIWGFLRHRVHSGWREVVGSTTKFPQAPLLCPMLWSSKAPERAWGCCAFMTAGTGSRALLMLLLSYLWSWVSVRLRSQRCVFCFPGCYWILKLWVQIPLPEVQNCRHWLCFSLSHTRCLCFSPPTVRCTGVCSGLYWHPIMLGMFYWLWIEEERQK